MYKKAWRARHKMLKKTSAAEYKEQQAGHFKDDHHKTNGPSGFCGIIFRICRQLFFPHKKGCNAADKDDAA